MANFKPYLKSTSTEGRYWESQAPCSVLCHGYVCPTCGINATTSKQRLLSSFETQFWWSLHHISFCLSRVVVSFCICVPVLIWIHNSPPPLPCFHASLIPPTLCSSVNQPSCLGLWPVPSCLGLWPVPSCLRYGPCSNCPFQILVAGSWSCQANSSKLSMACVNRRLCYKILTFFSL